MSENIIKNPKVGGVKIAKQPKEHVPLPQLHFIAAMDWIDKLGEKAFCGYLKLFTMGDRDGKSLKKDEAKIPSSLDYVRKEIGCAKGTFYEKIIKPLWNYCLIDLEEWEESDRKSQKPVNIIIYPYPNMEFERMVLPLEKLRDYDKDYNSEARIHARKKQITTVQKMNGNETGIPLENPVIDTVQNLNGGPSKNRTVDRLKIEHNNLRSNSFNNSFNSFNNLEEEEEEDARALLSDPSLKLLNDLAVKVGFADDIARDLVTYVNKKGIANLNESIFMDAFGRVQEDLDNNKTIVDIAKWTAGKIALVAKEPKLNIKPIQPKNGKESGRGKYDFRRQEVVPDWFDKHQAEKKQHNNQGINEQDKITEAILHLKEAYEKECGLGKPFTEYLKWEDEQYSKFDVAAGDQLELSLAFKKLAIKQRLDRLHQGVN